MVNRKQLVCVSFLKGTVDLFVCVGVLATANLLLCSYGLAHNQSIPLAKVFVRVRPLRKQLCVVGAYCAACSYVMGHTRDSLCDWCFRISTLFAWLGLQGSVINIYRIV